MNTYTEKLLNDGQINTLAQRLLGAYKVALNASSAGGSTSLADKAQYKLAIEGDNLEKLVIYFILDDYYQFIEFGVNGIGYRGDEHYKQDVVSNGLFSFKDNGKNIPVDPLEKWITKKNIKIPAGSNGKVPSARQYAFMLSRTIKKHGIKPRHLLAANVEENDYLLEAIKLRIAEIFNEVVDEELKTINE